MDEMPDSIPTASWIDRWRAVLRQRCPRCLEGRVYTSLLRMNETCPLCEHRFQREPGYFLGAMYISYPMSVVVLAIAFVGLRALLPDLRPEWLVLLSACVLVPFVPSIVRWSRILWMHWVPPEI